MRLFGTMMFWSLPLGLLVPLPLFATKILFKAQKGTKPTDQNRKELNNQRPIYSAHYFLKLVTMMSNILRLPYSREYEQNSQSENKTPQYEPNFLHLIQPVANVFAGIIGSIKQLCQPRQKRTQLIST
jgi:hypothetical protein